MRKFTNPVQQQYYDAIWKLFKENTDDWYDMNNFIIACMAVVEDVFRQFADWTIKIFKEEIGESK